MRDHATEKPMPSTPRGPRRNKVKGGDDREHREHLGQRIRLRRIEKGLSQEELAQLMGCAPSEIHRWERGERMVSSGRLGQLANALSVPVAYFFDGDHIGVTINEQEQLALAVSRAFAKVTFRPLADHILHTLQEIAACCDQLNAFASRQVRGKGGETVNE